MRKMSHREKRSFTPAMQLWRLHSEPVPFSDRYTGFRHTPVGLSHSFLREDTRFSPCTENSTAHATISTWTCLPLSSWEPWLCWWKTSSSTTRTLRGPTVRKSGCPTCQRYVLPYRWPRPGASILGTARRRGWGGEEREKAVSVSLVRDASPNFKKTLNLPRMGQVKEISSGKFHWEAALYPMGGKFLHL